jgi:hypothetical protein
MSCLARPIQCIAAFTACLILIGCSGSGKTVSLVPASGKVTVDGKALTAGTVTLHPDSSKGNNEKYSPTGQIDQSGNFKLTTDGRDGAPVGWYKVSVTQGMSMSMPSDLGVATDPTKALGNKASFNSKYQNADSSGISLEVVATPPAGGYEIKLTK